MASECGSSQASNATSPGAIANLNWDFFSFFRIDYPNRDKSLPSATRKKVHGHREYVCLHCVPPNRRWSNRYPNNAIYHARKVHARLVQASEASRSSRTSTQASIDSFMITRTSDSGLRNAFNAQRYSEAVVGLLTRRRVPFSAVEWEEMKSLALACNPAIEDLLITSRRRAMRIIDANFTLYASQLRETLEDAQSMIHISTDLWTSPHRHGMLAVCAQWVDKDHNLRKALLGLLECRYRHSGEAQAALIAEVLQSFNLSKRIGYHTGDNATSNDTCLETLSEILKVEHDVDFDPKRRRIRCIGHIINLSLQALLLARSKEALKAALDTATEVHSTDMLDHFSTTLNVDVHDGPVLSRRTIKSKGRVRPNQQPAADENYSGWQGIPALRKLHNIAMWLRSSSLHSDSWRDAVGLSLGIDNATRWSSWYKVIDNAMKKKQQINQFLIDHDTELDDNVLNGSDWDLLDKTHAFLQPFALATLYAEGKCSSVAQSLVLMDALLLHYEQAKIQYSDPNTFDNRMLHAIEMGWFVLNKYYTMTEDVPVYAAALLLDPSKRRAYIEQNWPSDWHQGAISGAREIWEAEYNSIIHPEKPERSADVPTPLKKRDDQLAFLLKSIEVKKKMICTDTDNLDAFINASPIEVDCTPLEWWSRIEQRKQYPRLSRMAIDILSIPSESAEPERSFSGARRTTSWDRLRITCQNLQKVECIGNWLREGLIIPSSEGGLGLVCGPEPNDEDMDVDPAVLDESELESMI